MEGKEQKERRGGNAVEIEAVKYKRRKCER
jgi:hypothetical protein